MEQLNKKILACDDEEGIRESLKLILADEYEMLLTDNAAQCLNLLKQSKDIGLVLLDIKMPQVNGLEVLKQIKEYDNNMKVIMITGYNSVETAQEAAKLGANGYIVKPFKSEEILETVQKQIGK